MNWMNLPEEYCTEKSKFVILPISYEKALTYGTGTSKGPQAIIEASQHLEYYDEQFQTEAFLKGIQLLPQLNLNNNTPEEMVNSIKETISKQNKEKFIISLGGDHAVTIGIVKGLEQHYNKENNSDFSIIQFDAHSDYRDSWNGSQLNHACVANQIKNHEILQIGIRSQDADEAKQIEQNPNLHIIYGWEHNEEKLKQLLPQLKDKVYITIDVDAFDPSFIRNTGTPEPGGLTWNQVISALQIIFKEKEVIGADIVEFAPKENAESEAYTLAKLAYKIMNLKVKKKDQTKPPSK